VADLGLESQDSKDDDQVVAFNNLQYFPEASLYAFFTCINGLYLFDQSRKERKAKLINELVATFETVPQEESSREEFSKKAQEVLTALSKIQNQRCMGTWILSAPERCDVRFESCTFSVCLLIYNVVLVQL